MSVQVDEHQEKISNLAPTPDPSKEGGLETLRSYQEIVTAAYYDHPGLLDFMTYIGDAMLSVMKGGFKPSPHRAARTADSPVRSITREKKAAAKPSHLNFLIGICVVLLLLLVAQQVWSRASSSQGNSHFVKKSGETLEAAAQRIVTEQKNLDPKTSQPVTLKAVTLQLRMLDSVKSTVTPP